MDKKRGSEIASSLANLFKFRPKGSYFKSEKEILKTKYDFNLNESNFPLNELPDELLEEIFLHLPAYFLCKQVILVCSKWKNIIDQESFWFKKCQKENKATLETLKRLHAHNIFQSKRIYFFNVFDFNLLKNPCAEEKFRYWCFVKEKSVNQLKNFKQNEIKTLFDFYNENVKETDSWWAIEDGNEHGSKPFLNEKNVSIKKFVTSYSLGEKMQIIDLNFDGQILIDLNCKLEISEYYTARWDCVSEYYLAVYLIDKNFKIVDSFYYEKKEPSFSEWEKVSHTFDIKNPIQYILFYHAGKDRRFWAGNYGSKMTNGSVKILF